MVVDITWNLADRTTVECVFADPPMGNAPHFSTGVTDTSIVISWTPVPRIGYKVHLLQTHARCPAVASTSCGKKGFILGLVRPESNRSHR